MPTILGEIFLLCTTILQLLRHSLRYSYILLFVFSNLFLQVLYAADISTLRHRDPPLPRSRYSVIYLYLYLQSYYFKLTFFKTYFIFRLLYLDYITFLSIIFILILLSFYDPCVDNSDDPDLLVYASALLLYYFIFYFHACLKLLFRERQKCKGYTKWSLSKTIV